MSLVGRGGWQLPTVRHTVRSMVAGMLILCAFMYQYYFLILNPGAADKGLLDRYREIASGTAHAPDQYRVLVPYAARLASQLTGLPLRFVVFGIDSTCLLGGGLVVVLYLRYRGQAQHAIAACAYIGVFAVTSALYPRPETIPTFLCATVIGLYFLAPNRDSAWGAGIASVLLLGMRPDYAGTAATVLLLWAVYRQGWARLAVAVAALAVITTVVVLQPRLYPHATYLSSVVQLKHNLHPESVLASLLFLLPLALPAGRPVLRDFAYLRICLWVVLEFAAVSVVGRLDEARIFFPFSGVIAMTVFTRWQRREVRGGLLRRGDHLSKRHRHAG